MSNNELGPQSPADRSKTAEDIRIQAAASRAGVPSEPHCGNGDDAGYASLSHYASYSKGLRHNERGEVDDESYASMIKALSSGKPDDFDRIILGAPDGQSVKLTNPQAGLAFDLEGVDGHALTMKPAPHVQLEGGHRRDRGELLARAVPRHPVQRLRPPPADRPRRRRPQ